MAKSESFDRVVGALRYGDEDAASEVFQRFGRRLIALCAAT